MRLMGSDGVAVFGVIMYVNFIFVSIFLGYSMGSAPIVGYHYGAGNRTELQGLLRKSLRLIGVLSAVLTAEAELLARPLAMIFVSYDANLLAVTQRAFAIYAISFLLVALTSTRPRSSPRSTTDLPPRSSRLRGRWCSRSRRLGCCRWCWTWMACGAR